MAEDAFLGRTIGSYRIEKKLGEGGMGTVFKAVHTTLDRDVALKILPARLVSQNRSFVERFLVEARAAAKLSHPNIVQVHDAGHIGGQYYIAMEFVAGMNVAELHMRKGSLTELEAVEITLQAARGLAAAAEARIVHRDIKPENLMITAKGQVKVADFGLAKNLDTGSSLTQTGQVLGTPSYMSPEQGSGETTDFRSDIYSLGVTLFEMVTDCKPFEASTPIGVLMAHVNTPIPDPKQFRSGTNARVCNLIRRMMAKRPQDRFDDYDGLLRELILIKRNLLGNRAGANEDEIGTTTLSRLAIDHGGLDPEAGVPTKRLRGPNPPSATASTLPREKALAPGSGRGTGRLALGAAVGGIALCATLAALAVAGVFDAFVPFAGEPVAPPPQTDDAKPVADPKEDLSDLLTRAKNSFILHRFPQAESALVEAARLQAPADATDSLALINHAKARLELTRACIAEGAGQIPKALEHAEKAGGFGIFFPELATYISRLEDKRELLVKFPPGAPWCAEHKKRIMVKMINGLELTDREREFYKRFSEWESATCVENCFLDWPPLPGTTGPDGSRLSGPTSDLLERFPPGAKWNRERRGKIRAKMVGGQDPTPAEKEFYKRFEEWEKACARKKGKD